MTAPHSGFPPINIQDLNSTPLSQHIASLFRAAKEPMEPGLVLASLAWWAQEHLKEMDWRQVQPLVAAVLEVELEDARALYGNLAQAPGLMEAPDLPAAAHRLLQHLVALAPPR